MVDEFRGDTEWPSKDERLDLSSFSDGTFVMVEVNNLSSNVLGKRSFKFSFFHAEALQQQPVHSLLSSGENKLKLVNLWF